MSETDIESEVRPTVDASLLENSLTRLWERARLVSDLVLKLKEENKSLKAKTLRLEQESNEFKSNEQRLREETGRANAQLLQLRQELLHAQTNGSEIFSKEEKEALKARIRELITRINSRL